MPSKRNQRPTNVRYYAANRDTEIERVARRQAATTSFLRELREVPCFDCGERFAGHQMDFDHRNPAEKSFTLCSGRAALKSRAQIIAEARQVRRGVCKLPQAPQQGAASPMAEFANTVGVPHNGEPQSPLALPRGNPRPAAVGSVRRLRRAIRPMLHGLRSSRSIGQGHESHTHGWPRRDPTNPCGSRQVRYRLRELSSASNV